MKKIVKSSLILLLCALLLSSCNGENQKDTDDVATDGPSTTEVSEESKELKADDEKNTGSEMDTDEKKESEGDVATEKETESSSKNDVTDETKDETKKDTEKSTDSSTDSTKSTEKETEKQTEAETEFEFKGTKWYLTDENAFSVPSGIYDSEFSVKLYGAKSNQTIYYTLDCSEPTTKSKKYTGEIKVDFSGFDEVSQSAVTVIRFAIFEGSTQVDAKIYTSSYIMVKDKERFNIPVISLVTDDDNLYGSSEGIFVKGDNNNCYLTGRKSERDVHFEYFDYESGELILAQNGGMRLMGQGARELFLHKTLRLFARKDYDVSGKFKLDLYSDNYDCNDNLITKYDSLILRSGSSNTNNAIITTQYAYLLAQDSEELDTGLYSPATVFLNGKYYGYMAVLEDYSPEYFAEKYDVSEDYITTLNGGPDIGAGVGICWQLDDGPDSEYDEFISALKFVKDNDMSKASNYKKACEYFDMDNFAVYMIYECYMDNWDWPRNNVRVWRYNENGYNSSAEGIKDGRWRFLLKDLDAGFGMCQSNVNLDFYESVKRDRGLLLYNEAFLSLLKNTDFNNKFLNYLCDLLGTTLSEENQLDVLNKLQLEMSAECAYLIEYYKDDTSTYSYPDTLYEWNSYVEQMRTFIKNREAVVLKSVRKANSGIKTAQLTVNIEGNGYIKLNSIDISQNGFEITYFRDINIPYSISDNEGFTLDSISLEGGTVNKDGTITLTSSNPVLTVKFKSGSKYKAESNEKTYDESLKGAYLINGRFLTADTFKIENGVYYIEKTLAREIFKTDQSANNYISTFKKGEYIELSVLLKESETVEYEISDLDAHICSFE